MASFKKIYVSVPLSMELINPRICIKETELVLRHMIEITRTTEYILYCTLGRDPVPMPKEHLGDTIGLTVKSDKPSSILDYIPWVGGYQAPVVEFDVHKTSKYSYCRDLFPEIVKKSARVMSTTTISTNGRMCIEIHFAQCTM